MSDDARKSLPQLVDRQTVASALSVSIATMKRWAKEGRGPQPIKIGARRVGYLVDDVTAWVKGRTDDQAARVPTLTA